MKRMSGNVVDLPEELIGEILLRLPVKPLLRFKCVCKEWYALIRSRRFIVGHYCHESNRDCILIERWPEYNGGRSEFFLYPDDGRRVSFGIMNYCVIMGPANGIFCAVDPHLKRVVLFNPATRKLKHLPPINPPLENYLEFGFGFDPFSGDYKVVVIEETRNSQYFYCVYNSSSDSWGETKVVDSFINDSGSFVVWHYKYCRHEVFLNGVYYWLIDNNSIRGFDMRSESFHEILPPDAISDTCPLNVWMTAYGDSVALLSGHDVSMIVMWVMGGDGLWTKKFSIATHLPRCYFYPVCVWNKNELLIETSVEHSNTSALFKCDISTQEVQEVQKLDPKYFYFSNTAALSYKESLFPIEGERDIPYFFQDIFLREGDD